MVTDPLPLAAAVPSTLVGALIGALVGGPHGFLLGGVVAGAGGTVAAKLALQRARGLTNMRR